MLEFGRIWNAKPKVVELLPDLERPAGLRLLETRTFSSGVVYLGFAAR